MPIPLKAYRVVGDLDTRVSDKPALVIDTNVVLNWLFFADPATVAVITTLQRTHHWVSTPWMQHEAQRVATLPMLAKYATPHATLALEQGFAQYTQMIDDAQVHTQANTLRCRDADDQVFLDLALHTQAPLLLTLDRDLLKLQKRARLFGINIAQPFRIAL